ncbi:helix-turn-helix DNA binding domain protein [Gordonia phage Clown]|uniref:Helix-turn-helix DNA binding domain protein n=1 Tax=Gordonia phage Clown TaxID=2759393 RepID=A0A7L7SLM2_9CAUD|nr:transcriptional regulator WhiB-like [Gordonia phage Clown]QOC56068.1 helix-turn-helix DNA binding domain protein [Gordonia phage Clown]
MSTTNGINGMDPAVARRQIRVGQMAAAGIKPADIAEQLGTTTRTIRRDLRDMEFEYPTRHRDSCGTPTGYRKHYKYDESPCDACRDAKNRARRKASS